MALNDKEKTFAYEYIINKGNAYQAALKAGYSKNTAKHAYQWMESPQLNPTINRKLPFKPELKEYIEKQLEKIESEKSADAKEVIEYLTSVMRGEHTEQILRLDGEGVQVIDDIAVSEKERLKAATELAKILGLNNRIDLEGTVGVVIVDDIENC